MIASYRASDPGGKLFKVCVPARTELIQAVVLPKLVLRSALPSRRTSSKALTRRATSGDVGAGVKLNLLYSSSVGTLPRQNAKRSNHPRQDSGH